MRDWNPKDSTHWARYWLTTEGLGWSVSPLFLVRKKIEVSVGTQIISLSLTGLLQKEQDSAVVYGSIDTGKTVFTHDKFQELVSKFSLVAHCLLSYKLHAPSLCGIYY